MSYVDVVLCAVPTANKDAYLDFAKKYNPIFKENGALQIVDCWGADVPEGKVNSLHTAVLRKDDETVAFSWIVWPSKEVRDTAWEKIMADPIMANVEMPYDGQRMIFGGFDTIFEG